MEWTNVSKTKDLEIVRAAVDQLDINERDQRGRTPLMLFIINRMKPEATKRLQTCCSKRKARYVGNRRNKNAGECSPCN
ncbi:MULTISPECIES: hypothetical protein [unclassified Brevibacillus]|uniref:hypothetical protein n=1 Tax=unclassified Brevibacillus TaxID=2684853 RepID=UPI0020A6ACE1|nr:MULTISPECIES: hypothetical protein [unclassified Brevibacillus]